MKTTLIFLFFILTVSVTYSQDVKENYDKFKQQRDLRLEDDIDLKINTKQGTFDLEVNIVRVSLKADTVYYFTVNAQSIFESWAGEGMEGIILLNDTETIDLISAFGDFKAEKIFWQYWIGYEINKDQLIDLYTASKVEVKCYLREGSLEAKFRNEDKETLNSYLKNYLLKGLV